MAAHHRGATLVLLVFLATLLLGVLGSPLAYPDFTPRVNAEVSDLLAALLEEEDEPQQQVVGWSRSSPRLGQVSGVAIDPEGRPVIFHRGPVSWLLSSFNNSHHYQLGSQGAIPVDTILTLHPVSGVVVEGWGRNAFYLPHGIAICPRTGDTWLTDVALHQVFRHDAPVLTLGKRFEPGSDARHFCKPTSVAIASGGDVFVTDGYCNQRVLHFTPDGRLIAELGRDLGSLSLTLPHGVALIEERDVVCIADREAKRIVCIRAGIIEPDRAGELGFHAPHAIAVTPDGNAVYVGEIGPNRLTKFMIAQ
ncbi:hypothetical protein B566_EDAN008446 [Ephemera danica]|nr:hypothetical protein B566_EDAN008446 [Ephemera danica]